MTAYWGHVVGVITVILLVAFVGVWIWAWLPRHKTTFERMARLPLERGERPGEGDAENPSDRDTEDHGGNRR